MSPSCGSDCVKYLLFLFNLLFVITGVIIISVGVSVKNYYITYETFVDKRFLYAPEFLIAIGALIFVISFFGCCGAIRENACLTLTFSTLLLLVFFLELAAGIGGYVLKNATHNYMLNQLSKSIQFYKQYDDVTFAWDTVQKDFHCCGVINATDWLHVNATNGKIPTSCCDTEIGAVEVVECTINSPTMHLKGCVETFGVFIKNHTAKIETVGLSIAFLQFVGIALSCYFSNQIRKGYQTV